MLQITQLTNAAKQTLDQILENGETFNLRLEYSENCNCWFFGMTYQNFILNNCRLVLSSNLLKQWENILPFGLLCFSAAPPIAQQDPFLIDDLIGNPARIQLYVLTAAEILELENEINQS